MYTCPRQPKYPIWPIEGHPSVAVRTVGDMKHRLLVAIVAVPLAVLSVAAATTSGAASSHSTHHYGRPKAGHWKFLGGDEGEKSGKMTVTKGGKRIKGLTLRPPASCSTKRVKVLGSYPIKKGNNEDDPGRSGWHVGATSNTTKTVPIKVGTTKMTGGLYVAFDDTTTPDSASVELSWSQSCDLNVQFEARK